MSFWQLDSRCVAVLRYLADSEDTMSIQEISRFFNVSVRSVYYDLSKINDWLQTQHVSAILVERNRGVYVTKIQSEKIKALLKSNENTAYYVLSPKERHRIQICTLLSSDAPVFVEQLSHLCSISRNTTFNDLKIVREKIERYGLELSFEPQKGYEIHGLAFQQRAVFLYYFTPLISMLENNQLSTLDDLPFYDKSAIDHYVRILKDIEIQLDTSYVEGMIFSLATLIYVIVKRKAAIDLKDIDAKDILETKEFQMVENKLTELSQSEQIYIAMHLLGSRVQINTLYDTKNEKPFLYDVASQLVKEFEILACLEFDDRDQLISLIANHLSMSIYRYKFGIQIGNPLMSDIMASYPDLFELTMKAAKVLKERLMMPIPDFEIAYITMHLGGYLHRNNRQHRDFQVLIVCPNGISTATILRGEIESLHPNLKILDIVGIEGIAPYLDQVDFIISTVDINAPVPVIKVKPIITEDDRLRILSRIVNSEQIKKIHNGITLESVLSIISNYVAPDSINKVKKDLSQLFSPTKSQEPINRDNSIRLEDVLCERRIRIVESIETWEESITAAAKPLLDERTIDQSYIEAMIAGVNRYGPYIVIGEDVALAHALPQDGVNALSLSLMILKSPVCFRDRCVSLLFVLAPIDKSSHLGIMKDLMSVVSDDVLISKLKTSSPSEIMSLIKSVTTQKGQVHYDD
jgi:mannitol operon transcriptional antiterminator